MEEKQFVTVTTRSEEMKPYKVWIKVLKNKEAFKRYVTVSMPKYTPVK